MIEEILDTDFAAELAAEILPEYIPPELIFTFLPILCAITQSKIEETRPKSPPSPKRHKAPRSKPQFAYIPRSSPKKMRAFLNMK